MRSPPGVSKSLLPAHREPLWGKVRRSRAPGAMFFLFTQLPSYQEKNPGARCNNRWFVRLAPAWKRHLSLGTPELTVPYPMLSPGAYLGCECTEICATPGAGVVVPYPLEGGANLSPLFTESPRIGVLGSSDSGCRITTHGWVWHLQPALEKLLPLPTTS